MQFALSLFFLLIAIWQLTITRRTFTKLQLAGNNQTSPFMAFSLASSLLFALIFLAVAISCLAIRF